METNRVMTICHKFISALLNKNFPVLNGLDFDSILGFRRPENRYDLVSAVRRNLRCLQKRLRTEKCFFFQGEWVRYAAAYQEKLKLNWVKYIE